MSRRPWYPFFVADYRDDTALLSHDADLLYRRLLDAYWLNGGPLPAEDRKLAKLTGYQLRKFRRCFAEVSQLFSIYLGETEPKLRNRKMDEIIAQAADKSEKASQAARSRWDADAYADAMRSRSRSIDPPTDPRSYTLTGESLEGGVRGGSSLKSASAPSAFAQRANNSNQINSTQPVNKGRRWGERETVPLPWRAWAIDVEQLPRESVNREAAKFADYWRAKSGAPAVKRDWEATWRNWIRGAVERGAK